MDQNRGGEGSPGSTHSCISSMLRCPEFSLPTDSHPFPLCLFFQSQPQPSQLLRCVTHPLPAALCCSGSSAVLLTWMDADGCALAKKAPGTPACPTARPHTCPCAWRGAGEGEELPGPCASPKGSLPASLLDEPQLKTRSSSDGGVWDRAVQIHTQGLVLMDATLTAPSDCV